MSLNRGFTVLTSTRFGDFSCLELTIVLNVAQGFGFCFYLYHYKKSGVIECFT